MRFTVDGESFDLTPELVRARLDGQSPEDIREYWVEIDGVCWPVKQVIALSTGAKRTRFQSQDSRRWLRIWASRSGPAVRKSRTSQGLREVPLHAAPSTPPRWERSRRWTVRWAADEPLDLGLKSAHRLAENAVVLRAQTRPETAVLNIDADLAGAESDDE